MNTSTSFDFTFFSWIRINHLIRDNALCLILQDFKICK